MNYIFQPFASTSMCKLTVNFHMLRNPYVVFLQIFACILVISILACNKTRSRVPHTLQDVTKINEIPSAAMRAIFVSTSLGNKKKISSLLWCHKVHDGVSNNRRPDGLLKHLCSGTDQRKHQSSASLALGVGVGVGGWDWGGVWVGGWGVPFDATNGCSKGANKSFMWSLFWLLLHSIPVTPYHTVVDLG